MLYRPSKNLTCVVYQDQKHPKCFELNIKHIKLVSIVLTLVGVLLFCTTLFFVAYFKQLTSHVKNREPVIINQLNNSIEKLKEKNSEYLQLNQNLTEKLKRSKTPVKAILPVFSGIADFKDLSGQKLAMIEDKEVKVKGPHTVVRFNIVNPTPNKLKLSGHIVILLKQANKVEVWPASGQVFSDSVLDYSDGELFGASRFRPVEAIFSRDVRPQASIFVKIYIFNRSGDLLLSDELGPIKNSPQ